jgi:hypothetical protein
MYDLNPNQGNRNRSTESSFVFESISLHEEHDGMRPLVILKINKTRNVLKSSSIRIGCRGYAVSDALP